MLGWGRGGGGGDRPQFKTWDFFWDGWFFPSCADMRSSTSHLGWLGRGGREDDLGGGGGLGFLFVSTNERIIHGLLEPLVPAMIVLLPCC
jgi:hypothetical protein